MTHIPHDSRIISRLRLLLGAAVLIACSALPSFAQTTATGVIRGRVYNPATKEYVANAEVSIANTILATTTGADGTFVITNVPAGTDTVTVTYTGSPTISGDVVVAAGETVNKEFSLGTTTGTAAGGGDEVVQLAA